MGLLPVLDNRKGLEFEHAKPKAKVVESGADGLIEHREITKPRGRRSADQVSSRAPRRLSAHDNGPTGNAADEFSTVIVLAAFKLQYVKVQLRCGRDQLKEVIRKDGVILEH